MRGHRDLVVWQKAMILVTDIYQATREFPKDEVYGLRAQLRRAAVSVPSNLAEGHGRNSRREFHQFIGNARGSLTEVETQIEIAKKSRLRETSSRCGTFIQASEVARMLNGLRKWSETVYDR